VDILKAFSETFLELLTGIPVEYAIPMLFVAFWGASGWAICFFFYLDNKIIRKANRDLHNRINIIYQDFLEKWADEHAKR
jgi:hypothetical protein